MKFTFQNKIDGAQNQRSGGVAHDLNEIKKVDLLITSIKRDSYNLKCCKVEDIILFRCNENIF